MRERTPDELTGLELLQAGRHGDLPLHDLDRVLRLEARQNELLPEQELRPAQVTPFLVYRPATQDATAQALAEEEWAAGIVKSGSSILCCMR